MRTSERSRSLGSLRTGQTKVIGQLESSLVRIYSTNRKIVGAGFLVADRQVLTCAHVVARALGLAGNVPEAPQAEVRLDFPLVAAGHIVKARGLSASQFFGQKAIFELLQAHC